MINVLGPGPKYQNWFVELTFKIFKDKLKLSISKLDPKPTGLLTFRTFTRKFSTQ